MSKIQIGDGVEFECSNGGVITIIGDDGATDLSRTGADGMFAYYDDLHIDSYSDLTVDVAGEYHTRGTVQHVTGDPVMHFNLLVNEGGARADFKLTGLQSDSWYRLQFGGNLAKTEGGRAHGKTNDFGRLDFTGVTIPND